MKPIILIILTMLSLQMISQECTQISIDHIDNTITYTLPPESTKIYITPDGNGDFYFEDANALDISKDKNISILVDDIRFFDFYTVEVIASESEKKISTGQPIELCQDKYILAIKVGDRVIQSKSINLK